MRGEKRGGGRRWRETWDERGEEGREKEIEKKGGDKQGINN